MEIRFPAPCLIVLVGPSGSGKTTWAREHFARHEIVSSDELRAVVGTGEDDQEASRASFELLEAIVAERTRRKLTTVIDTLGHDEARRRNWISVAHSAGLPVYAVRFDTEAEVCIQRNEGRPRPIPRTVVRKQVARHKKVIEQLAGEEFDSVVEAQPVAVVPPQMTLPTRQAPDGTASPRSHTFGLLVSRFNWGTSSDTTGDMLASIARRAEHAGFRDIWVMDHFRQIGAVGRPWEDIPEAYVALAFLAGHTSTIRLGTLVTGITYRNPIHLGKIIATLDVLSGGRANCGIGLAWDRDEHTAYGWDFPNTAERYDILEDTLELLPLLWGKGAPAFEGRVIEAAQLVCYPRPIQEKIPILVGGSGEKRTLRLVAAHADACNVFGSPERVRHKVRILGDHCENLGRDPGRVEVTHLTNVLAASDRNSLRERVEVIRGRNQSSEDFARRNNAGTPSDLEGLFHAYHDAGAAHSIVSMPDVHLEGGIEAFADVIAGFVG